MGAADMVRAQIVVLAVTLAIVLSEPAARRVPALRV